MSFFVKTSTPEDWKLQLAEPDKQWENGYSAKDLAYCWMKAKGFPSSVKSVFLNSDYDVFKDIVFLAGFVEHKVPLPPERGHPSQNDIFVLAKSNKGLVSIAVEGKVDESFDKTVKEWRKNESKGKKTRLNYLTKLLQISQDNLEDIRYQLLHRTASAIIEAKRFNASTALMLVHSFSKTHKWFDDYANFASLFGITTKLNTIHLAKRIDDVDLYLAWVAEKQK